MNNSKGFVAGLIYTDNCGSYYLCFGSVSRRLFGGDDRHYDVMFYKLEERPKCDDMCKVVSSLNGSIVLWDETFCIDCDLEALEMYADFDEFMHRLDIECFSMTSWYAIESLMMDNSENSNNPCGSFTHVYRSREVMYAVCKAIYLTTVAIALQYLIATSNTKYARAYNKCLGYITSLFASPEYGVTARKPVINFITGEYIEDVPDLLDSLLHTEQFRYMLTKIYDSEWFYVNFGTQKYDICQDLETYGDDIVNYYIRRGRRDADSNEDLTLDI